MAWARTIEWAAVKLLALGSRVARRIILMLVVFIIIPLVAFSFYASSRFENHLDDQVAIGLRKNAKVIGMDIIGQLRHVDELLHLFGSRIPLSGKVTYSAYRNYVQNVLELDSLSGLALVKNDNSIDILKGIDLAEAQVLRNQMMNKRVIGDKRSMILPINTDDDTRFNMFLAVPLDSGDLGVSWLVVRLRNDYLFGFNSAGRAELICVFAAEAATYFCNRTPPAAWIEQASARATNRGPGSFLWLDKEAGEQITGYWPLNMTARFLSEFWMITMATPSDSAAGNFLQYRFLALIIGGLVVMLLLIASMGIVRRYLKPIDKLIAATRLLSTGRFDARVSLHSKDEFEEMGAAFNNMAGQLGQQFFYQKMLAKLGQDLTESTTVSNAMASIADALVKLPGASAFAGITAPGFGQGESSVYQRLASKDTTRRADLSEIPSTLPTKRWSGSGVEMTAEFPELSYLCPRKDDTVILIPVLIDREVKVVIAFNTGDGAPDEMANGFLLQIVDSMTSTFRSLSLRHTLRFQAEHDVLTGLANRNLLNDTARREIAKCREKNSSCGLIIFDIDRFKLINDSKGHLAGDELLRQVGGRLESVFSGLNMVSRMAGDEFVILLSDLESSHANQLVARAMEQIVGIFRRPFPIGNWLVPVSCSIGAAIWPQDGANFFELLQHADTAMYSAKRKGLGELAFYSKEIEREIQEQVELENGLRKGLQNRELTLHYQPVVDVDNRRVAGAEALVRWQHPERGLVSPFVFLGIAERMGLLPDIGKWVFNKALDDFRRWKSQGYELSFVAVNISGVEFAQEDFVQYIINTVDDYGMKPADIELEVTETEVIADMDNGIRKLGELRDAGFKISLDDFGTGYSSMEYLKMMPVDKVKIDMTFIKDIEESSKDQVIVKAMCGLAKDLDLKLVAEGVETKPQLDILQGYGAGVIQGYYFSRPLAEVDFLEYLGDFEAEHFSESA